MDIRKLKKEDVFNSLVNNRNEKEFVCDVIKFCIQIFQRHVGKSITKIHISAVESFLEDKYPNIRCQRSTTNDKYMKVYRDWKKHDPHYVRIELQDPVQKMFTPEIFEDMKQDLICFESALKEQIVKIEHFEELYNLAISHYDRRQELEHDFLEEKKRISERLNVDTSLNFHFEEAELKQKQERQEAYFNDLVKNKVKDE